MRHVVLVFAAAAASFSFAQRDHGPPPSALANECGAGIAWQPSLEAALARAKEIDRPVFWYVATVPRSPMDRKPVIDLYMRAGMFSMPEVIAAIEGRFVAVKEYPSRQVAAERRLVPLEFIEPGFVVLKPDGTEIGRVDRITTFHERWLVAALDRILDGHGTLARPSDAAASKPADDASAAQVALGRAALRAEDWPGAEKVLAALDGGSRHDEARWLLGVARHRQNRQAEAVAAWKAIVETAPRSPWAAKAAAEIEGHGPFVRGFEEYGDLRPEAMPRAGAPFTGTQAACDPKDSDWLVRRSVRYLLERQDEGGGWTDSNYDFGGRDSLPDVHLAVSALAALALLEWEDVEPDRTRAALARATAWLADPKNGATDNLQERVWAHAYRVSFFARLAEIGGPRGEAAGPLLRDVARKLGDLQSDEGRFAHEYPNPFATATALLALDVAARSGVPARPGAAARGAAALKGSRGKDGAFSYGFDRTPGSKNLDMAAGRMSTCELALLRCGAATQASLEAAIRTSFDRHAALEQVRKYDDHSPPHGIGGFFFWYDVFGRCLAIDALEDRGAKRALLERERALIAGIAEIDGRFVDSHEIGKPYGTAMALLSLRLCMKKMP